MKWWAQSFLVGVPKIVCGFRNDDGIVKTLQTFKTTDIPRETQVGQLFSSTSTHWTVASKRLSSANAHM